VTGACAGVAAESAGAACSPVSDPPAEVGAPFVPSADGTATGFTCASCGTAEGTAPSAGFCSGPLGTEDAPSDGVGSVSALVGVPDTSVTTAASGEVGIEPVSAGAAVGGGAARSDEVVSEAADTPGDAAGVIPSVVEGVVTPADPEAVAAPPGTAVGCGVPGDWPGVGDAGLSTLATADSGLAATAGARFGADFRCFFR